MPPARPPRPGHPRPGHPPPGPHNGRPDRAAAMAHLPPPPVHGKGKKGGLGRVALALASGGASEIVRAATHKGKKGKSLFGEALHGVGNTKGIGRVALALATGGGSEVARFAAHESEKLIHGPGSAYPARRQQGRLENRTHPAHGEAVEAATAVVEGRDPARRPPVPSGRLHPQRRLDARAKHGFYNHIDRENVT